MPTHFVPNDTKYQILILYEQGRSIKDICTALGVKKTLAYSTLRLYKIFGTVSSPYAYSCSVGRPRVLMQEDIVFIRNVIQHHNTIYLDELQKELWEKRHVYATISTIFRALQHLEITRKGVSFSAAEQSDELRALYMNRIGAEARDAEMLLFVDEAVKDRRTSSRPCGWSTQGQRCYGSRYFICGVHYSIIPAITLDGIISYDIIEGPVDGARFLRFLWECVVCNIYSQQRDNRHFF